jgi:DNA invertase Pin-like site-specific DNA recombinase
MGHLLGYARVSTTDQHPQLQVDAPQAAGCSRVFTETASGTRPHRPPSTRPWTNCGPATPWSSGNSTASAAPLRHLVDTITGLADRGVGFPSLQEAIDTTTPGGKLVFHVFAALAEIERDLVRERTTAGLAAARARGRHGGRPSVLAGHTPGGPRDVCVRAIHGGGNRHDPRREPGSIYRHVVGSSG